MEQVNQGSQAQQQSTEKPRVSKEQWTAIRDARAAMERSLALLQHLVGGAAFRQDQNLLEFVHSIRKKILVKKQGWLPQKYFKEQPTNLFWVEGTSLAILYNYIPRGNANVYHVTYTSPLVNLTRMIMAMRWSKAEAIGNVRHCQFVCEKTNVFTDTDLVWTTDRQLFEKHRAKIEFFADKY
jgi:hypothetical protein|uniref:Uncharacterized protein n=1 Tax=Myoviridae sp. ctshb19 TaxID=2825194 RepID=A0A8S5UG49_9CAUD|nr:MAG TPA: hypothetical protein [Myoviridae sp. ctshb19]